MKILIILILIDCYLVTGCKSDRRNFKSHLESSLSSEALFSTAVPESERLEQVDQLAQISMMSFYERSINVVTDEEFTI
ncbi:MAG: hypothetical protein NTX25_19060, partial [Proteobacteria bacterium]|nr:hypothetical protein [Pseudomonadota bacterium]